MKSSKLGIHLDQKPVKAGRESKGSPFAQRDTKAMRGDKSILVCAVIRNYKGRGKQRLILHEASAIGKDSFAYGAGRHWVFPLPRQKKTA